MCISVFFLTQNGGFHFILIICDLHFHTQKERPAFLLWIELNRQVPFVVQRTYPTR